MTKSSQVTQWSTIHLPKQELQKTQVRSLGWEDPLEKGMATHSSQYSCLENPMDRGTWWATVYGVTKELDTTEQLNNSND